MKVSRYLIKNKIDFSWIFNLSFNVIVMEGRLIDLWFHIAIMMNYRVERLDSELGVKFLSLLWIFRLYHTCMESNKLDWCAAVWIKMKHLNQVLNIFFNSRNVSATLTNKNDIDINCVLEVSCVLCNHKWLQRFFTFYSTVFYNIRKRIWQVGNTALCLKKYHKNKCHTWHFIITTHLYWH